MFLSIRTGASIETKFNYTDLELFRLLMRTEKESCFAEIATSETVVMMSYALTANSATVILVLIASEENACVALCATKGRLNLIANVAVARVEQSTNFVAHVRNVALACVRLKDVIIVVLFAPSVVMTVM
jgi:hypothetical protein